mmetsp:Transcript_6321/g.25596  ORF Transcript_6321/g.25596 Transcript_6321/m.25596 type:complete len:232 (+) Transcript_6321:2259-2954(+)
MCISATLCSVTGSSSSSARGGMSVSASRASSKFFIANSTAAFRLNASTRNVERSAGVFPTDGASSPSVTAPTSSSGCSRTPRSIISARCFKHGPYRRARYSQSASLYATSGRYPPATRALSKPARASSCRPSFRSQHAPSTRTSGSSAGHFARYARHSATSSSSNAMCARRRATCVSRFGSSMDFAARAASARAPALNRLCAWYSLTDASSGRRRDRRSYISAARSNSPRW